MPFDELGVRCPQCGSEKCWRDGIRYTKNGRVQRFLCRHCGYRFSETKSASPAQEILPLPLLIETNAEVQPKIDSLYKGAIAFSERNSDDPAYLDPNSILIGNVCRNYRGGSIRVERVDCVDTVQTKSLKSKQDIHKDRQISAICAKGAKNLVAAKNQKQAAGISPQQTADIKGSCISFLWWMEKQGYAPTTTRLAGSALRALMARGANLADPETVKDALARETKWSQARRRNVINTYTNFLKSQGLTWEKPRCKVTRKIPFIPTEQEIDDLIAGCSRQVSTFLQLLKETAMRSGEAKRLLWTDIDFERRIIILNEPEKNGLPRIWNPSRKLLDMLNALPRKSLRIFGDGPINSMKTTFLKARRRLSTKLQNPRLLKIHFHTLRHWKATMEYHRTKDLLHTMAFLGHKKSDTTLIYVQLDEKLFKDWSDNFITRVAHNVQEACGLVESGFEYVTGEYNDGGKIFRKRK